MPCIQGVELLRFYDAPIFCPFCGQKVLDLRQDALSEPLVDPCPHTLFAAHDMGFEYRASRFDEALNIVGISDDDLLESEDFEGFDALTNMVEIDDSVKFASYVGPPSGYGTYIGFAPLPE